MKNCRAERERERVREKQAETGKNVEGGYQWNKDKAFEDLITVIPEGEKGFKSICVLGREGKREKYYDERDKMKLVTWKELYHFQGN